MPSPYSPTSIATLVARDISYERGGRTVLDRVSISLGPETCLGSSDPTASASRPCSRSSPACSLRGRARCATTRRLPRSGTWPRNSRPFPASPCATRSTDAPGRPPPKQNWPTRRPDSAKVDRVTTTAMRWPWPASSQWRPAISRRACRPPWPRLGWSRSGRSRGAHALGWAEARLALAVVILSRFDLTLLDEPTNDLDFDGLGRLESFVAHRHGGMVIVSHDRAFSIGP